MEKQIKEAYKELYDNYGDNLHTVISYNQFVKSCKEYGINDIVETIIGMYS